MPNTYSLISTTVTTGSQSSISFPAVPQAFTDLNILIWGRSNSSGQSVEAVYLELNGATSGYINRIMYGETTGTGAFAGPSAALHCGYIAGANATSDYPGCINLYIPNYSWTQNAKVILCNSVTESTNTGYQSGVQAFTYGLAPSSLGNNPVTSMNFRLESGGTFTNGTVVSLYGIKKA
jgi:hypothetical protein